MAERDTHEARRRHSVHGRERSRAPAGARVYGQRNVLARGTDEPTEPRKRPPTPWFLRLTRYGLPGVITLAGVVAMCFGTPTALIGGSGLVGAGIATAMVSWFYRIGVESDAVRVKEDYARRYYARFGRWPDGR
jgi:hypothetical protein